MAAAVVVPTRRYQQKGAYRQPDICLSFEISGEQRALRRYVSEEKRYSAKTSISIYVLLKLVFDYICETFMLKLPSVCPARNN